MMKILNSPCGSAEEMNEKYVEAERKFRVFWRDPDCGYNAREGIVRASSEKDIPKILAKICECGEKDIELGPYYEIFDLDQTPRSTGMSREEMKNVMELILSYERMKTYGASW